MKTQKVQFGIVLWFDETRNKGLLQVRGEPQIWFSLDSQRVIVAGFTEPEFGSNAPKLSPIPQRGAQVAILLGVDYECAVQAYRRTLRRSVKVVAWNYAFAYQDVKREIAARPVYEVVEYRLINGNPVSVNQRETLNFGTAVQLQHFHARGAKNDPFAPESEILDFTLRRRFYQLTASGRKIQCADPRPLPDGQIEVFRPTNEQGLLLATGPQLVAQLDKPIFKQLEYIRA